MQLQIDSDCSAVMVCASLSCVNLLPMLLLSIGPMGYYCKIEYKVCTNACVCKENQNGTFGIGSDSISKVFHGMIENRYDAKGIIESGVHSKEGTYTESIILQMDFLWPTLKPDLPLKCSFIYTLFL